MAKRTTTKSASKAASKKPAGKAQAQKKAGASSVKKKSSNGNPGKKRSSERPLSSSSKRTTAQSPFAEKLNTVTPSGYKDQTFFEQVFDVARQIPKGRVTSYGAIAASLGAKSSSRLVGWAMNLAGSAKPRVPAHRVVNRIGMLSGKHHFSTPTQMQELLEKEGVKVKNDKVVEFSKLFWDPMDL